jgi:Cys-tRNA(Pro)/Cys-tRNA(Cys) deacylase
MTPAIKLLENKKVNFEILSYEHDSNNTNFGQEALEKLTLNAVEVFKTLVLETNDAQLIVAITPVTQTVNLKQLASASGCKKVVMADVKKVENSTGYIVGGVSPLGQKKRLKTFLHTSAQKLETLYISAGKRGLEIAMSPEDLKRLTSAHYAEF